MKKEIDIYLIFTKRPEKKKSCFLEAKLVFPTPGEEKTQNIYKSYYGAIENRLLFFLYEHTGYKTSMLNHAMNKRNRVGRDVRSAIGKCTSYWYIF